MKRDIYLYFCLYLFVILLDFTRNFPLRNYLQSKNKRKTKKMRIACSFCYCFLSFRCKSNVFVWNMQENEHKI